MEAIQYNAVLAITGAIRVSPGKFIPRIRFEDSSETTLL